MGIGPLQDFGSVWVDPPAPLLRPVAQLRHWRVEVEDRVSHEWPGGQTNPNETTPNEVEIQRWWIEIFVVLFLTTFLKRGSEMGDDIE